MWFGGFGELGVLVYLVVWFRLGLTGRMLWLKNETRELCDRRPARFVDYLLEVFVLHYYLIQTAMLAMGCYSKVALQ